MTKPLIVFIVVWMSVLTLMILDHWVFRPREPIGMADQAYLELKRDQFVDATSSLGRWQDKRTIHRSKIVVSANLLGLKNDQQTIEGLTQALTNDGWKPSSSISWQAAATFCKGRYRALIFQMKKLGLISISFITKEFKSDNECEVN